MNKIDYAALRLDPRWQRKRLEVMERDEFKCVACGDEGTTLNVHHAYYVTGRMPWDYPMFSLSTLCRNCHKERHTERELDPDEIASTLSEWEMEMDWMLDGKPQNDGPFWHAAANIARLVKKHGPEVAYKLLETLLEDEK